VHGLALPPYLFLVVIHQTNQIDLHKRLGVFGRSPLGSRRGVGSLPVGGCGSAWQCIWQMFVNITFGSSWLLLTTSSPCNWLRRVLALWTVLYTIQLTPRLASTINRLYQLLQLCCCCYAEAPLLPLAAGGAARCPFHSQPAYSILYLCNYMFSFTNTSTDVTEPFSLVSHTSA
jgi:hypothetical protein